MSRDRRTGRLLLINNIPTPYRTYMFNRMHEIGAKRGVEVTVRFQASREERRPWDPSQFDMRFPHSISAGWNPWRKKPKTFFTYPTVNADILWEAATGGYDWVMFAPFMCVGNWLQALAPTGRARKLVWSESNMTSARYVRGLAHWWKRLLLSTCDVLVCPGQRAVDYVLHFHPGLSDRPVLWLPNIVDTSIFSGRVAKYREGRSAIRSELGIPPDSCLVVGLGQMIEKKGFHFVIEAVARVRGPYTILLLGDGPLRTRWAARIEELRVQDRIRLPGQADEDTVARHLAAADWFLHSAQFDPSPLVVIEASLAGLPLAVSTQTGNSPEAVEEGGNGFTFDPTSPESMAGAIERMARTTPEDRARFGRRSLEIAEERFHPDGVLERFFDDLTTLGT